MLFSVTLALSAGAALINALPAPNTPPTRLTKRSSCTFTDAASATASKTACSDIVLSGIAVPAGTTLDMTDLNSGTTVTFEGTTTFGYKEWDGPLISFSGTDITINGASGNLLNGEGSKWWDGEGSNGGKTKPKFFYAHDLKSSSISNLNIENTPVQCFSINGATDLTLSGISIDNSAGDDAGAHNTDAFDVGSSDGVYITGATVKNQDDCLAINSGNNITFTGGSCSGSHGLSIGSIGGRSDNTASDITISSSSITNAANGLRIKTISGATGTVSNVKFEDITMSDISTYGIVIEQDYENGGPTGTPTNGVKIEGLTVSGVTGSVDSDATEVYILCGDGSCTDWTWSGVDITGGKKSSSCENIPSGASC